MSDCIFCKIILDQIPAARVYEDEFALAFRDIDPKAPTHLLVIPKKHYANLHDIPAGDTDTLAGLWSAVNAVLRQESMDRSGYRLVVNSGTIAGQAVPHIHVHILSGRTLSWPPG